jgi:hypothetical protein
MRITERDTKLVRDIALSHLLGRDQVIGLGYFNSVTRANTRLRELAGINLVRRLDTPFYAQSLYMAGSMAHEIVGDQVSKLLEARTQSPRFIRHALSNTNVRIALSKKGGEWRFEQQLWRTLKTSKQHEIRPDGLFITSSIPIFVEVDLGHVSPAKFREKLFSYRALAHSGQCGELYGFDTFRLLTVTTGPLRSRHLRAILPNNPGFEFLCQTFDEIGVRAIPNWS